MKETEQILIPDDQWMIALACLNEVLNKSENAQQGCNINVLLPSGQRIIGLFAILPPEREIKND